ncbi:unnamed protein product [Urochloa humidicola]
MAASAVLPLLLLSILVCSNAAVALATGGGISCGYTHLFSFGDSISDPGNFVTFFHRPTGCFCDGRLIINFIAEALGLAFAPPFLGVIIDRVLQYVYVIRVDNEPPLNSLS